jgi:hypothetical protein
VWIAARHLALILSYFVIGKEKKTSYFGTYRVEVFVALFSRVVDPQNMDVAIKTLVMIVVICYVVCYVMCYIFYIILYYTMYYSTL